jgi:hypothetical protein
MPYDLTIGDKTYEVGDDFAKLPPEHQQAAIAHIAGLSAAPTSPVEDATRSLQGGAQSGIAHWLGGPADLARLAGRGIERGVSYVTGTPLEEVRARTAPTQDLLKRFGSEAVSEAMQRELPEHAASNVGYEPVTKTGKYLKASAESIPAMATGPVSALVGAVAGERLAQAAEGTRFEPIARLVGNIVAPTLGARAIAPVVSGPGMRRAADVMEREGVPITAGQATGSTKLKYAESTLADIPLSGHSGADMKAATDRGINEATARRMGSHVDEEGLLSPQVIGQTQQRLGDQFRDLSARNVMEFDGQLVHDLRRSRTMYPPGGLAPEAQNALNGYTQRIGQLIQPAGNGRAIIPGAEYQNLRSELSEAAQSASNNREANVLRTLRNALDDAMDRSIARNNPADVGAWREAREHWGAMRVIQRASNSSAENASIGNISPKQLNNGASQGTAAAQYARGEGPWSEFIKAANATTTPLPNSGTAQRLAAIGAAGAIGGLATNYGTGDGNAAVGAGLLAALGTAAGGRVLLSRPAQTYLANRLPGQRLFDTPQSRDTYEAMAARALQSREDER